MSDEAARHYLRAELLSDLGRSAQALEQAAAAIAADPEQPEGWFAAARAHVVRGDYGEALTHADRGLAIEESGWGHRVRSVALSGLGQHQDALDAGLRARELQPDEWRCFTRLARCFRNLYREEEAERALESAAALAPEEPSIFAQWARLAYARGQFAEAERRARYAVSLGPEHGGALTSLGAVLEDRDPDASFGAYARALRLDPSRVDLQERVREVGTVLAVWPLHVATVLVLLLLASLVVAAMSWPVMGCVVVGVGLVGASFLAATRRRGRQRLDAAAPGGAALFESLRGPTVGR